MADEDPDGAEGEVETPVSAAEETSEASTEETEGDEAPPSSIHEAFARAKAQQTAAEKKAEPLAAEPPAKAATGKAVKTAVASDDGESLITDDEFTALQQAHKDDPAALRKSLEGAFTKKTQKLAEQRRSLERLTPYSEFVDAYEEDPEAAIRALAGQHGVTLPAAPTPEATVTAAVDHTLEEFKTALGPELEYLAEPLAPAIRALVERLTDSKVKAATEPLQQQTHTLLTDRALSEANTILATFEQTHPDYKTHETAMTKLSEQMAPQKGMTEQAYLEALYTLVTHEAEVSALKKDQETQIAEGVKRAIQKINKGAERTPALATPARQVRTTSVGTPSFQDAFEAAKRGERWE